MESDIDLNPWLRLHLSYATAKQLNRLIDYFGSLEQALAAEKADWQQVPRLPQKLVEAFFQPNEELLAQAMLWATQPNQRILTLADDDYPGLLKQIADPPILLYVRGDVGLLNAPQLAVVGSRQASRLGVQVARDFSAHLSSLGLCITSGLAHGIDAAAHQGGLSGIGKTLAVIGTGIDRIYPAANQALARQIAEQGAIVSEFPLGTRPLSQNFPLRNRIISGMATGCLVVEAALKSGSLITARQAMEQGREVFAIPGSINNSLAKGCHALIKQGAKLVESSQDILEELAPLIGFVCQQTSQEDVTSNLQAEIESDELLAIMEQDPLSLDELIVLSKLPASEIQARMTMFEIDGLVHSLSAGRWRKLV